MHVQAKKATHLCASKRSQAALGQHPATIYRKVHAGELPAVRLGEGRAAIRIPRDELER